MSQLENALDTIINIYHQYSIQQAHPDKLNHREFKKLVEKELPCFLKNQVNPTSIDGIFKQLDQNQDKELNFEEFMVLITRVTIATHKNLHDE